MYQPTRIHQITFITLRVTFIGQTVSTHNQWGMRRCAGAHRQQKKKNKTKKLNEFTNFSINCISVAIRHDRTVAMLPRVFGRMCVLVFGCVPVNR